MIKHFIAIASLTILVSCWQDNKKGNDSAAHDSLTNTSQKYTNPKLRDFDGFIAKLDTSDASSSLKAATRYRQLFAGESSAVCDSAFVIFDLLYRKLDRNLNEKHWNDSSDFDLLFVQKPIVQIPAKVLEYDSTLRNNGFRVAMDEGMTYVQQDRKFIADHFYTFVSKEMREYLAQLDRENEEGFSSDGGSVISPTKMVERIIWYEKFLTANPGFIFGSDCKSLKKFYLTFLLNGMDNTPLYGHSEKKVLSSDFREAYEYMITKYPEAITTALVRDYYKVVEAKEGDEAATLLKKYESQGYIFDPAAYFGGEHDGK